MDIQRGASLAGIEATDLSLDAAWIGSLARFHRYHCCDFPKDAVEPGFSLLRGE